MQRLHETFGDHAHTRIDRIYTPLMQSNINWQRIGPHPALFTGKGALDHLPLLGRLEYVGYKTGRVYDIKIQSQSDLMEDEDIRRIFNHVWRGHITADTPDDNLDEAWTNAKRAVATYLLWATRQGEEQKALSKAIDELALLGITLNDEGRNPGQLDRIRELNQEIADIRRKSKPSKKTCFDALKHEKRMTKEFFNKFKAKTSNSAIHVEGARLVEEGRGRALISILVYHG